MDFSEMLHTLSLDKPLAIFVAVTSLAALILLFVFLRSLFSQKVVSENMLSDNMTDRAEFIEQLKDVSEIAEKLLSEIRQEVLHKEELLLIQQQKGLLSRLKRNVDVFLIGFVLGILLVALAVLLWFV
jgi:hypothetical protein